MLPSGALLIDKPEGLSSSQVVSKIKWTLTHANYAAKGFKIGHGGTLDPFAVGTLIIFLGEGTKLADTYLHSQKAYDGIIRLGTATDSGDLSGAITEKKPVPDLTLSQWQTFANQFVTEPYLQTPPMFSAKKRDGTPLYELARAGIEVAREPILKKITLFELQKKDNPHELSFTVNCESGTYVRVLAEDLAKKAGTVAHLKSLRRTQSSDALISECTTLAETIELLQNKTPITDLKNFRPLANVSSHVPFISVDEGVCKLLWNGIQEVAENIGETCFQRFPNSRFVLARHHETPIALFENLKNLTKFRLQRVFNEGRNG